MKVDAFIDVQGFIGADAEFVTKEIAIVFDEANFKVFRIISSHFIKGLNTQAASNMYHRHHVLYGIYNDIRSSEIKRIMTEFTAGKIVVVRGQTNVLWVFDNCQKIIRIHNTEKMKFSYSFKELRKIYPNIKHCNEHKSEWCALQNARLLQKNFQ